MAALWTATVLSLLVAGLSLTLTFALARRLRALVAVVNKFLPVSEGDGLPYPGTPLPAFAATSAGGQLITPDSFSGPQRLLIFLSTSCASCTDQVPLIQRLRLPERPVVVVTGEQRRREEMAALLTDVAEVVHEEDDGPLAAAFELREFPAILVIGKGFVNLATHSVKTAAARLDVPVTA